MGHETCLCLPSWAAQATPELGTLVFVGLIGIYSPEKPKEIIFFQGQIFESSTQTRAPGNRDQMKVIPLRGDTVPP